jgi:iron complex transport system permease protein
MKSKSVNPDQRKIGLPLFLILLVVILMVADLSLGSIRISPAEAIRLLFSADDGSSEWMAVHLFRLPRIITAVIAGISLAVSGLQMQTVFRNPLAGPYVLGISAGAGLGVALAVLGFSGIFSLAVFQSTGNWLMIIAAWLGSAAVLLIILLVSFRLRDIMTILIIGMMLGSGISALISILQYFSQEAALKAFVIWTMGSISNVDMNQVPYLLAGFLPGMALSVAVLKPSDAVLAGENYARTMGVNIIRYRILVFAATSFLTGTVTAFCGPIGFVGIAVPHIARLITGATRSRLLFVYSILIGSSLMLASDILTQVPPGDLLLPLNAITSIIGIPIVIFIVVRKKKMMV